MDKGKIVVGVLAGVAVGALIGVLFAPDKGTESREKLASKATDGIDDIKEKLEGLLSGFLSKYELAKTEVQNEYAQAQTKTNEISTTLSTL